ncbi:MAG: BMP family ABC transporter substrate-binding protein [Selenomonadaceae bacterium]|nr:BMP family ABC transporter substrate-binding protein [Selenomonadaceae bacterium]
MIIIRSPYLKIIWIGGGVFYLCTDWSSIMNITPKDRRLKFLFVLGIVIIVSIICVLMFGFDTNVDKQQATIGFVIIGDETDTHFNELQYINIKSACEDANVRYLIERNVKKDAVDCKEAVKRLVKNGAGMIFISSYSYAAPLKNISREYPHIAFATNSTDYQSKNMSSYFVRMYQGRFLAGAIAGLRTKTNVIGYVAAISNSEVNLDINAFALGVQQTNPKAKVLVMWTGSWHNPTKEAANTERLIKDFKADVITYHQDDKTVADTAEKLNVDFIGYNDDFNTDDYSDHLLTSIVCRWDIYYRNVIQDYLKNEINAMDNNWLDINTGTVLLTNYSDAITSDMHIKIEALRQQITNGRNIFSGLIYDNEGSRRCVEDETISDDALLKKTNWLVKGVEVIE